MGEWKPIETAPKNGTQILALIKHLWDDKPRRRIIYWSHEGNCVMPCYFNTWMCDVTTLSQQERYILGWTELPPLPAEQQ